MNDDLRLIHAIQGNPLDGPSKWARSSGLDLGFVRRKYKQLQDTCVLRGFSAIPAATVFGRKDEVYAFKGQAAIDDILAIDNVAWVARVSGRRTLVHVFETKRASSGALEALLGPADPEFVATNAPATPALGRIELKILRALLRDPRMRLQDLCLETGLTMKTVRKHRQALMDSGALVVEPIIRPPTQPGPLFYHFGIRFAAKKDASALRKDPNLLVLHESLRPPAAYVLGTAEGLEAQAAQQQRLAAMDGVVRVRLIYTESFAIARSRLQAWIDEEIAKWD